MTLADAIYERARGLIAERMALDFAEHRRTDLERALTRAVRATACATLEGFLAWLAAQPRDAAALAGLAHLFTVGESYFFRDRPWFDALQREVLPSLIVARRGQGNLRLRLWSAGCASGEEPYSLAIALDRLLPDRAHWRVTILATDLDAQALERAQRGLYRSWALRDTTAEVVRHYFQPTGDGCFLLVPKVRRMVSFEVLNLAGETYPTMLTNTLAMDLIVCRNVLMYFTPEAQRSTVSRFQRALVQGGWLAVAPVEASAALLDPLQSVSFPHAVFYRNHGPESASTTGNWPPLDTVPIAAPPTDAVVVRPAPPVTVTAPSLPAAPSVEHPGDDLARRAESLADQGRLDEARALCARRLAAEPLDARTYLLLGSICQEQGDLAAAATALERCIYLAPESAVAHFVFAGLLQRQGRRAQARRCFDAVVRLLQALPAAAPVPWGGGVPAGRLGEMARLQVLGLGGARRAAHQTASSRQ